MSQKMTKGLKRKLIKEFQIAGAKAGAQKSNQSQPSKAKTISATQYLKDSVKFFFSPRQYIGKTYIIEGKKRKIIAETTYNVLFDGMRNSIPKEYLKTISNPTK